VPVWTGKTRYSDGPAGLIAGESGRLVGLTAIDPWPPNDYTALTSDAL